MSNRDISAAVAYHDGTKHSLASVRSNRHYLDWDIKPLPFKVYPSIDPIPLPRELPPRDLSALTALATTILPSPGAPSVPGLHSLARILHFSAGITKKKSYPGRQDYYFRAAACTGALYHIDLYVVCGTLPELAAGVYHFSPHDFALRQLRSGDFRGVLVEAAGADPALQAAPVIIACASTYWRNAWKYQARAYRHCFWDCGTILANLLAVAAADTLPAHVVTGFVDERVHALMGLDADREGAVALVAFGHDPTAPPPTPLAVPPLQLETLPLSEREVEYPEIAAMQAASTLSSPQEVTEWRRSTITAPVAAGTGSMAGVALHSLGATALASPPIDQVILRRGSTRQFAPEPIRLDQLSTILACATAGVSADFGASPSDIYLIVNAVDGLAPGTYAYDRAAAVLEPLRAGTFRQEAGYLGLSQDLPADASVNLYMLCDLEPVLRRFGNRGYRVAQLDAAIIGGRMYLAAYALGLGATGLTFFDDDVTRFFSPHAQGKSVMFLVAVGRGQRSR